MVIFCVAVVFFYVGFWVMADRLGFSFETQLGCGFLLTMLLFGVLVFAGINLLSLVLD